MTHPRFVAAIALVVLGAAPAAAGHRVASLDAVVEPVAGPLVISLDAPKPSRLLKKIKVAAIVSNEAGVPLAGTSARLHVPDTGLDLVDGPIVVLGDLKAGAHDKATWELRAVEPGSYVLVATALATTPAGNTVGSGSAAVVLDIADPKDR
jgi:hypothetical protein